MNSKQNENAQAQPDSNLSSLHPIFSLSQTLLELLFGILTGSSMKGP